MVLCTGLFDLELHYSDVKSPVGRVRRFKDTVTGSPVLSMGKEQELDKGDSFSKDKPTPLKSPTEQRQATVYMWCVFVLHGVMYWLV